MKMHHIAQGRFKLKTRICHSRNYFFPILLLLGFAPVNSALPANLASLEKTCSYCHGQAGASIEPDVPTIGGYSSEFLFNNIKAYRDHERHCADTKYYSGPNKGKTTNMCEISKDLTDSDIRQIAVLFSKLKFAHAKQQFDPALAEKGKLIHETNCEQCHSKGATQANDDAGMMAGQWMPYLRQAFDEFLTGKRPLPKKMKRKLDGLTPEDIEALVNFYGSY